MDLKRLRERALNYGAKKSIALALCCGGCMVLTARQAEAFCRTRACDPLKEPCAMDANRCITTGAFLYWPNACASFSVNQAGSPKFNISYTAAENIISDALSKWLSVDCGSGVRPSLEPRNYGAVSCGVHVYDRAGPNANVWMFADKEWGAIGDSRTLALTSVSYAAETGEIFDADVEINSAQNLITTSDVGVKADLESIVTHEAGHFLGLEHSADSEATMWAGYFPGNTRMRDLAPDDIAAICEAYPQGRPVAGASCDPRRGFTKQCYEEVVPPNTGCSVTAGAAYASSPANGRNWGASSVTFVGLAFAARRRRHRANG